MKKTIRFIILLAIAGNSVEKEIEKYKNEINDSGNETHLE